MPTSGSSLANEYDLMITKTTADWDRIGELVAAEDPHGHLVSIHNFSEHFDHTRGRGSATPASNAPTTYRTAEDTDNWRRHWGKPVVVDECGYEGDLEYDWGNLSGEEMLRRFWEGAVRGGYVGHGETYWDADEEIWWAKGGRLVGTSHARIGFLDEVVAASPTGVLEPLPSDFDLPWAGVQDQYLVSYHGFGRPRERHVLLPPGRWHVDVLDTWECTVDRLPGTYTRRSCSSRFRPSPTRRCGWWRPDADVVHARARSGSTPTATASRPTAARSSTSTAPSTGTARTRSARRRAAASGTGVCAATRRRTSTTGKTTD